MIAIYARVSTEEQLKGYSIEGQIEDCVRLAETNDVLTYIDDGYTGEILNRPNLTKLLEDVEKGVIEKVICYDPDRLSRKLLNQLIITEKLDKHEVKLLFVKSDYKNDPEGNLYFQVRGAFSEFDKAKIKHNTMTGRYRKAKRGKVVKNGNMYGYTYDKENETYIINEKEAKIVRMIFDYYTDPDTSFKGINGIAHHLTELGIPTKKGKKVWHRNVVRQILTNESYMGNHYQNKYDTEGDYVRKQAGEEIEHGKLRPREEWLLTKIPPIISEEQFDFAQALIQESSRRYKSTRKHNYLLSGLVRCGRCGETMNGRKLKSHGKDFYVYECRKNYAGAKNKGCGRMMSENKLNGFVWSEIIDLLDNPDKIKIETVEKKKHYIYEEIEHLKSQIKKIKNGRERLLTLITISEDDDDIDLEEIKEKMKESRIKENDLQKKLDNLQQQIENEGNKKSTYALEEAIKYYLEVKGSNLDVNRKQKVLKMIIQEVEVIDADTVNIHTF
ncbi:recombinase family protein [Oceanobacillus indicireducens]|uniref:DNA recombinase n=1 Tax=Oceanobacillus indicireducens TaxID=1004261 RepID=A0A918D0H9_9BACI|nr:recombinase family protein [Oceanobacillus indicireducens]GGN54776.1 putative DNA recombinase [Oceanobacillus indicireducens]